MLSAHSREKTGVICVMDPLRAAEVILGDVETWPTHIIYNMFVVKLNTISVKKVVAFMYGNGVPAACAIDCFNACMTLDSYYVACTMNDWYCIWDNNPCKAHKAEYYSMSLKRWLWINGEALDQHEAVWSEITVMLFGSESTGYQRIIKTTIEHIRSCMLSS